MERRNGRWGEVLEGGNKLRREYSVSAEMGDFGGNGMRVSEQGENSETEGVL